MERRNVEGKIMDHFNEQNTEGFSRADMDLMNRAYDKLMPAYDDPEDTLMREQVSSSLGDCIANAHREGITEQELLARVATRMGYEGEIS